MTEPSKRRPKGTGTVRQKGSSWHASWWVVDPGTGKRAQRSKGGFPTQAKAEAHLRKIMVSKDDGTHIDVDRKMTVGQLLDAWLVAKQVEGRRPTTVAGYRWAIDCWIKPHIGAVKLASLSTEQVDRMLATLLAGGGQNGRQLSSRSVQLAGTVLRMALSWGVRRGHAVRNVASDAAVPSAQTPEMRFWSTEEAAKYIAAARADSGGGLFVLALLRGMRRGELCGLRWSSVDLDDGSLQVVESLVLVNGKAQASKPKTRRGRRRVPLDDYLVSMLREVRRTQVAARLAAGTAWHGGDYVFTDAVGRPLLPDYVSNKHALLCKAAGLDVIRMHDLRHSCASMMLAQGVPVATVAAILGQDPAITLRVYAHVTPGHADAAGASLTQSIVASVADVAR